MNGYTRVLGFDLPTRYLVGIGATVVAVLVLLVGGRGGSGKDQAASTTTTAAPRTSTTVARTGKSPITIRQRTAADLVIRADWVKKGSSQYADPSDDRASTQTITTLAPSTSAAVPRYRPATTTTATPGRSNSTGSDSTGSSSSGTGG